VNEEKGGEKSTVKRKGKGGPATTYSRSGKKRGVKGGGMPE